MFFGAFGDALGLDVEIYIAMSLIFIPLTLIVTGIYISSEHGRIDDSFKKLEAQFSHKKQDTSEAYEIYVHPFEFQSFSIGLPALLKIEENCISLNIDEKMNQKASVEKFDLNETEVLWVGRSGRPKDYYTWLLLKSGWKQYFISIAPPRQMSISWFKECYRQTAILYYKFSDAGYKIGIDKKKRGIILYIIGIISLTVLFCLGIQIVITGDFTGRGGTPFSETEARIFGGIFIGLCVYAFYSILFSKKGPPSRKELI